MSKDAQKNPGNGYGKLAWTSFVVQVIALLSDWAIALF